MQTDYVNSVVNVIMEIRERRKVKNEDEGRKKNDEGVAGDQYRRALDSPGIRHDGEGKL